MVSQIFYPNNLQEFFNILDRFVSVDLFESDAYRIRRQHGLVIVMPGVVINTDNVAEFHSVNRTERYIEVGSMVRLNKIFTLGKIVPTAIRQVMDCLYINMLRDAASIGSVICGTSRPEPFAAALIALDARCELRTNTQSRWISAAQLADNSKSSIFSPHEILYRIRIPLDQWDFTLCRYFDDASAEPGKAESGMVIFLARIQNDVLSDVRIAFSGSVVLRNRNCETSLIGQTLPLPMKDVAVFTNLWKSYLAEKSPPFLRDRILSFIEHAILQFSD
jgi:CO/xanthine dehydrogenase FAD-binding subunit